MQHEARDHLAGGESQLDAYAWPFLRKEQQEKMDRSAVRGSGSGRRESYGQHRPPFEAGVRGASRMDSTGSGSARSESYGQHRPPYEAEVRGASRMDSTRSGSARSESYGQHRPPYEAFQEAPKCENFKRTARVSEKNKRA